MRITSILLALAGLSAVGAAPPPAATDQEVTSHRQTHLGVSLESLDFYGSSEALNLRFRLTNRSERTLWVLRWDLPGAELDGPILEVTRDGEPVTYEGRLVKRAAPEAEDYIRIEPGSSHTVVFDPSAHYDMALQGQYRVAYRIQTFHVRYTAPEVRNRDLEASLLVRRSEEQAPPRLDSLPQDTLGSSASARAEFTFQGVPASHRRAVVEAVIGGYTNCTSSQQSSLQTAHNNAISISGKALTHLGANPNGSALYTYWFGTFTSSRFSTVKNHFTKINSAFQNQSVVYDCACTSSAYAYVYPSQPYKIYLCKAFWSAPSLGRDSKAGTLVHEMSHFNVTAGTSDYVYGATGAHNLALTNPKKAIMNADNHEYFAEDQ